MVPCSGHGSSHSINPNAIELGVIEETGEVETSPYENMNKMKQNMTDGPKNVLEFETMDHRVLRQREERRATFMANLDQRKIINMVMVRVALDNARLKFCSTGDFPPFFFV